MRRILVSALSASFLAGTAMAGSLDTPVEDPVMTVPVQAAPVMLGGDWTGGYAGLSIGQLSADADDLEDDETVYGLHGGYDYDFGQFVVGGELDWQTGDNIALGAVDVDNVLRAKLRGGYDLGRTLIYGTVGAAQLSTDIGDDTGIVGGLGVEYMVTDQFSVGGEFLAHRFEDFDDTDLDIDANTVSLRGSFRF